MRKFMFIFLLTLIIAIAGASAENESTFCARTYVWDEVVTLEGGTYTCNKMISFWGNSTLDGAGSTLIANLRILTASQQKWTHDCPIPKSCALDCSPIVLIPNNELYSASMTINWLK